MDEDGCKGSREAVKNIGVMHVFRYFAQNALDRSDRESGKWSEVREKSGNFVMKIKWQPCAVKLSL